MIEVMLRRGDFGPAVQKLQETLKGWGLELSDSPGHFGLWTEAAIYLLQRGEGLTVDGVVGAHTEARLLDPTVPAVFSPPPPLLTFLGVPYLSQRDNAHLPLSTCNVTALAMALRHRGVVANSGSKQLEDELYECLHSDAGLGYYQEHSPDLHKKGVPPEEVFDNLIWVAQQRGVSCSFAENRAISEIEAEVRAARPVLLSGHFVGSGHIVLLVGLCQSGDFIIHDPFGDWNDEYKGMDGEARVYARERTLGVLKAVDSPVKWGLFITEG